MRALWAALAVLAHACEAFVVHPLSGHPVTLRAAPGPAHAASPRLHSAHLHRAAGVGLRAARSVVVTPESPAADRPHIVLLPGFGNADVDYVNPFGQGEERSICQSLARRGLTVHVMPLQRIEWLNVLRGIFSLSFWLGRTTPYEPAYGWYVERARQFMLDAAEQAGGKGVVVVGHSAGGWLGRAIIGDTEWISTAPANEIVRALVTLGAPHFPPPPPIKDMTQGALGWTNEMFPGAHVRKYGIACVSVGSVAIVGNADAEQGSPERGAFNSYRIVCGDGTAAGDGVVPQVSSHLEGATVVDLPCYHSISPVGDKYAAVRGTWYGSDDMVDKWLNEVWREVAPGGAMMSGAGQ